MAAPLPVEVMWQAKQLYEEKDERGRRIWSMRAIAAKLGISETSVLRAVTNTGRFANVKAKPLPETQSRNEQQWEDEAAASFNRLQDLMKKEREEKTPGSTRADKLLSELTTGPAAVSPNVAQRAREFLDPSVEIEDQPRRDESGKPINPLDE